MHEQQKGHCKCLFVAHTLPGKKKSPAPSADARQKKNPASVGGVEYKSVSALAAKDIIICCRHDGIAAANLDNNAITGASLACIVSGGIQSGHGVNALNDGSSHYIALLTCWP
jgi:hypothetical protein